MTEKFWIDNTRMGAFRVCPQHYLFRHVWGYSLPRTNEYFAVGIAYHALWENRLKTGNAGEIKAYPHERPENSPENVKRVWDVWRERFETECLAHMEIESVEQCRVMDMGEFEFVAKIDLLLRNANGNPVVCDHKTTSMLNENFWKKFKYSPQLAAYAFVTGAESGIINACEKTVLDLSKRKKCKTHNAFKSDCWQQHVKSEWRVIPLSEAMKNIWLSNMYDTGRQIKNFHENFEKRQKTKYHNLMRLSSCPCQFENVCWHGENIENGRYVVEKWNPREM